MDRAKKKFASAIDGLRSFTSRTEVVVNEKIQAEHCTLVKIVRHGFPDDARCLAYDAVQRLLAIGTGHGGVRILGDCGVDYMLNHESDHPVNYLQFLINEGGLITVCGNDMIHLWNYRQKIPEIVHSIQLNKEAVTCIHLPMGSKWLYVGTDKGNIYFVSVGTFHLSSYIINWNKAIDLSSRVHPGSVRQIGTSPHETTKFLIAFEKGALIQWNLVTKEVDRFPLDPPIKCFSWHYDGKLLMTGNVDGSICIYNMRKIGEPQQKMFPHGQPCRPISIIDWKHMTDGDQLVIFAGGMPTDDGLPVPAITFLRASKSATVLEMDHPIISFVTLPQVPFNSCPQQPQALATLLKGELMIIDLQTPGYPFIESPHAMDLHEQPVTCLAYYSDCPSDLICALTLVGCKQRKKGFSERPWPINGGIGRECATGHQELILTGHKDGSLRFWHASGESLQILYRLKTASHFERLEDSEWCEKASQAVKLVELCVESRLLLVSGASGQVTLFRFTKTESVNSIAVVHIPQLNTSFVNGNDDRTEPSSLPKAIHRQKVVSRDSTHSPDTSDASGDELIVPFKVRGSAIKRSAGYQPELACLVPWPSFFQADSITAVSLNSAFGVIAIGMINGLALIDISQCSLIYAWNTLDLYGSDPTPAIQLQSENAPYSPIGFSGSDCDAVKTSSGGMMPLASRIPVKQSSPVPVSVSRRNTTAFATALCDRYRDQRPEEPNQQELFTDNDDPSISPRQEGCSSDQTTTSPLGMVRRFTKKSRAVARSISFHSHTNEDEATRDASLANRTRDSIGLSPSISSHSLEKLNFGGDEAVTSLTFIHSFSRRNDLRTAPCLWVGTSAGASIALNLILPQDRLISTIVVAPSGSIVKLKGQVLLQCFMDQSFCLAVGAGESYRENGKECKETSSPEKAINNKVITKTSLSPTLSLSMDSNEDILQCLVVVAELEVKVIALPSYSQIFVHKCQDIPMVKAHATHVKGYPVLMCLAADGKIVVISLPSLRLLHQNQLLPHSLESGDSICQKISFSEHGLGVYMASPSEVEKYTICAEIAEQATESLGELFVPCDFPDPPRNSSSFFKGVSSMFSGTQRQDSCDVDSILADREKANSGLSGATRSVARTIPGPSVNMERAQAGGISAGQAAIAALQNISERGEKLSATVDVTENLRNSAMNLSQRTGKLVEKLEKKKWYNF